MSTKSARNLLLGTTYEEFLKTKVSQTILEKIERVPRLMASDTHEKLQRSIDKYREINDVFENNKMILNNVKEKLSKLIIDDLQSKTTNDIYYDYCKGGSVGWNRLLERHYKSGLMTDYEKSAIQDTSMNLYNYIKIKNSSISFKNIIDQIKSLLESKIIELNEDLHINDIKLSLEKREYYLFTLFTININIIKEDGETMKYELLNVFLYNNFEELVNLSNLKDDKDYLNVYGLYIFNYLVKNARKPVRNDYDVYNVREEIFNKYILIDKKLDVLEAEFIDNNKIKILYLIIKFYKESFGISGKLYDKYLIKNIKKQIFDQTDYIKIFDNILRYFLIEKFRPYINSIIKRINKELKDLELPLLFVVGGDACRRYRNDLSKTEDIDTKLYLKPREEYIKELRNDYYDKNFENVKRDLDWELKQKLGRKYTYDLIENEEYLLEIERKIAKDFSVEYDRRFKREIEEIVKNNFNQVEEIIVRNVNELIAYLIVNRDEIIKIDELQLYLREKGYDNDFISFDGDGNLIYTYYDILENIRHQLRYNLNNEKSTYFRFRHTFSSVFPVDLYASDFEIDVHYSIDKMRENDIEEVEKNLYTDEELTFNMVYLDISVDTFERDLSLIPLKKEYLLSNNLEVSRLLFLINDLIKTYNNDESSIMRMINGKSKKDYLRYLNLVKIYKAYLFTEKKNRLEETKFEDFEFFKSLPNEQDKQLILSSQNNNRIERQKLDIMGDRVLNLNSRIISYRDFLIKDYKIKREKNKERVVFKFDLINLNKNAPLPPTQSQRASARKTKKGGKFPSSSSIMTIQPSRHSRHYSSHNIKNNKMTKMRQMRRKLEIIKQRETMMEKEEEKEFKELSLSDDFKKLNRLFNTELSKDENKLKNLLTSIKF